MEAVASTSMAENITVTVLLLLDESTAARRAARACDALKQYFVFSKICINTVTGIFDRYSRKIKYPEVQVTSLLRATHDPINSPSMQPRC